MPFDCTYTIRHSLLSEVLTTLQSVAATYLILQAAVQGVIGCHILAQVTGVSSYEQIVVSDLFLAVSLLIAFILFVNIYAVSCSMTFLLCNSLEPYIN